jgi:hypothetical protein
MQSNIKFGDEITIIGTSFASFVKQKTKMKELEERRTPIDLHSSHQLTHPLKYQ